jgi:hypothetical protein
MIEVTSATLVRAHALHARVERLDRTESSFFVRSIVSPEAGFVRGLGPGMALTRVAG